MPDIVMNFCAVDLTKVPKYSPEEENIHSVLNRLAAVEQRLAMTEEQTTANVEDIATMKSKMNHGPRNKTPYVPSFPPIRPVQDFSLPPPTRSPPRVTTSILSNFDEAIDLASGGSYLPPKKPTYSEMITSQSKMPSEEWMLQRRERRKQLQEKLKVNSRQVVTGNKEDTKVKAAGDVTGIYLYDIDSEFGESDIKEMITSGGVNVKHIRQILGHNGGFRKSFKVLIPSDKLENVMTSEFWPSGIKCREWIIQET